MAEIAGKLMDSKAITATANAAFITVKNFLGFVIIIEIANRAEMMGKRYSTIFTCFPWLKIKLFLLPR